MKDNTEPEVCILMATYNGERFLAEQIESILAQSYTNWKLVVSDDGSTDETLAIIRRYVQEEPRIRLLEDHSPCRNARDNFFGLAKRFRDKPYLMFCDQDDIWHEDKVREALTRIVSSEKKTGTLLPTLVFSDAVLVDEELRTIAPSSMACQRLDATRVSFQQLLIENVITGCTIMMNSALCEKALCFKETSGIVMHDWWCALVAARFGRIEFIDHATMSYRQHGTNTVGAKRRRTAKLLYDRITNWEGMRRPIRLSKMQAKAFYSSYADELTASEQKMLLQYSSRRRNGPLFYIRNRLLKKGIIANIPILLVG